MYAKSVTDAELLGRLLDPNDEDAWKEFEKIYRPKIYDGCRRLDELAAEGLTQAVLLKLRENMPKFRYDPESREL
jgi:hypothetical protein